MGEDPDENPSIDAVLDSVLRHFSVDIVARRGTGRRVQGHSQTQPRLHSAIERHIAVDVLSRAQY